MTQQEFGDTVVLTPRGHLFEGAESDVLEFGLRSLIERGAREIVVDLSETCLLSARAVGIFVNMQREAQRGGGHLALRGVGSAHLWLLRVTRVADIFDLRA